MHFSSVLNSLLQLELTEMVSPCHQQHTYMHSSSYFRVVAELRQKAAKLTTQHTHNMHHSYNYTIATNFVMERIVLVGFLPDSNGHSCELHPFVCGNSLVVNRVDSGVGLCLRLHSFVRNELAGYTIHYNGSEGCRVCFAAREYAAGENDCRFDGAIVRIVEIFTADHPNSMMRRLFHNHGYAYATVLSLAP